jgi:hypothetical protein
MDWNIKNELSTLEMADVAWLSMLGETESGDPDIEVIRDWWRGGAETYCYEFRLRRGGAVRHLIAKAMVAFNPAILPENQLTSWLSRRERLARAGVGVPPLFAFGKGLVIEQFIPFTLDEIAHVMPDLESNFMDAIGRVISDGFAPRDFVRNMRTDGTKVYWIDFGEDLGGLTNPTHAAKRALTGRAVAEFAAIQHH